MKSSFKALLPVAAFAAALSASARTAEPPQQFDAKERAVLRALCAECTAAMKASGLSTNLPVAWLSVSGDRGGWLLSQLKIAATDAGLNVVEGRDDPMWNAIVSEIRWDELKDDMLDRDTLVKFGALQGARILMHARLSLERNEEGGYLPELVVHADSVETKQHPWGVTLPQIRQPGVSGITGFVLWWEKASLVPEPYLYAQEPVESLLTVRVAAKPADEASAPLADRLVPAAENALAEEGFTVLPSPEMADLVVTLKPSMSLANQEANHYAYRGSVDAEAALPPLRGKVVAKKNFRADGKFVLFEDAAVDSLSDRLAPEVCDWVRAVANPDSCGLRVQTLSVSYAAFGEKEISARIAQFCAAAAELEGVVSCTLAQRLPTGNEAVFRIVSRPGAFPEGFIHRIASVHPELKLWPALVPAAVGGEGSK